MAEQIYVEIHIIHCNAQAEWFSSILQGLLRRLKILSWNSCTYRENLTLKKKRSLVEGHYSCERYCWLLRQTAILFHFSLRKHCFCSDTTQPLVHSRIVGPFSRSMGWMMIGLSQFYNFFSHCHWFVWCWA